MKVDKILLILAILYYKSLYIWCFIVEAVMKQDESQGCSKPSYFPNGICLRNVDAVRRGPKETKSHTKTILETIKYTV